MTDSVQVLLVTGMSGAGRSTALKVLEDLGYEAVDNLPLTFLPRLAAGLGESVDRRPVAVGVDVRGRGFGPAALQHEVDKLIHADHLNARLLFLDCDDSVLMHRYAETRRRHPLAEDRPVEDGLALERRVIEPLRARADVVVDTSDLTVWDLKQRLAAEFAHGGSRGMTVSVLSFSYRLGLPREADLVIDARFLTNPHYDPKLRPLSGLDSAVADAVTADVDFDAFWTRLTDLLTLTLPRHEREGKSYLTLAIGCTGGRHRSVFIAEKLATWLTEQREAGLFGAQERGHAIHPGHRDLQNLN